MVYDWNATAKKFKMGHELLVLTPSKNHKIVNFIKPKNAMKLIANNKLHEIYEKFKKLLYVTSI